MTSRRLEPKGDYTGSIWGELPSDYPTEQAERVYRYLFEEMKAHPRGSALVGHGFTGVAYRFRAATDYQSDFETSFLAPGGDAAPVDEQYRQERAIFGFFASGLAALESFSFAVHVISAHYEARNRIGISDAQLENVYPSSVAETLNKFFPNAPLTTTIRNLVGESTFERWNKIRNILSHRAIPPRSITFSPGSKTRVTWLFTKEKYLASDEDLSTVLNARRPWLSASLRELWDALEQSFPP